MKKVYVICPGNVVTGGPELLHQFVHGLNKRGVDASIVYFPFDNEYQVPSEYQHYNINVDKYINIKRNAVVILPEIKTGYSRYFKGNEIYIWWLSVDNYFKSEVKGIIKNIKKLIGMCMGKTYQIKISKMGRVKHLTQSKYAGEFLESYGYKSEMLSDYLNKEHFIKSHEPVNKQDIICYNPKKGYDITRRLIEINSNIKFVPIENMTPKEVSDLLHKSKVYIDFGEHPGKDRIPREAAMANCIIITGKKGSAKNDIDIPIANKYKHDESKETFYDDVSSILRESLTGFEYLIDDFKNYRISIELEEKKFNNEIDLFVEKLK